MTERIKTIMGICLGIVLIASYMFLPQKQIGTFIYSTLVFIPLVILVKHIIQYIRSRKGNFIPGLVTDIVEKVKGDHELALYIEFSSPLDGEMIQMKVKTDIFSRLKPGMSVRIWFNEKDPQKSIVMETFNTLWILNLFQLIVIVCIFLFFLLKSLEG